MATNQTVDTVDAIQVTGARIMCGTFPDGSEHVAIAKTDIPHIESVDPTYEAGLIDAEELPNGVDVAGDTT